MLSTIPLMLPNSIKLSTSGRTTTSASASSSDDYGERETEGDEIDLEVNEWARITLRDSRALVGSLRGRPYLAAEAWRSQYL